MNITLYGIPNCDTVKKARVWLAGQGQEFIFHDVRKHGLERSVAAEWLQHLDWNVLVNRKGTTWRGLPDARKAAILDAGSALALMLEFPSVIKRPVLQRGAQFHVGFSDAQYRQIFN